MSTSISEQVSNGQTKQNGVHFADLFVRDEFEKAFDFLLTDTFSANNAWLGSISNLRKRLPEMWNWFQTVVEYNVPGGKHLRGRMVEKTYKALAPDATSEMLMQSRILGWVVEMLQASYLVADDIMDGGQLRRGKPCWHRVEDKGVIAINDSFLLEHASYQVLFKYFSKLPCYTELLNLCLGVTFNTILGQSMDTRIGVQGKSCDTLNDKFEAFTPQFYSNIVCYKTSYYTCYLPVALAMSLAGISRSNNISLWEKVEKVSLEIGHFFQVQDDYFDCFGDPIVTGKVGTDIQDGKCTWLFVTAKDLLLGSSLSKDDQNEKDKMFKILTTNYGTLDEGKTASVKHVYKELGITERFQEYKKNACEQIADSIHAVNAPALQTAIGNFFNVISKRLH